MNEMDTRFANQYNIQWFPGHMTKTLRMMEQEIQHVDASLVLLDARIPLSSLNPEIERITARKPKLYALNKADLADPAVTEEWIRYFHAADAGCVAISAKQKGGANAVKTAIEKELAGLLERVDYTAVEWDGETVALPDGMELDFGSVAKGYAGQKAAEALRAAGVTSALLDLGGNIQTVGSHDGQPWRIGITDPEDPQSYLGVVTVEDEAVVTSGGYQRYFEENGVRYWHILDPATGQPARSGLSSVTIIGSDGGLCDGLSTALFVLGLEGAADYWRQWGGFEAVLITDEGQVWITEGLEDRFTLTGTYAEGTVEVLRQGD